MLNETIYIDGVDVREFGVYLQRPLSISGIVPILEEISVPGRSGTLTHYTGAYENREALAECYALSQGNVQQNVSAFSSFLFGEKGYRRLQTSTDEEHYLMARVVNGAQIDDRLRKLNPFEIQFSCMPQKFLVDGDKQIFFRGKVVHKLYNPYDCETKPLLTVVGAGSGGTITINSVTITVKAGVDNLFYIDCETENAYSGSGLSFNNFIALEKFPILKKGENRIHFVGGGIQSIALVPRWWEK
jgi:phage-related protein